MTDPTDNPITLERRSEHIAIVTLNRPEARNAVDPAVAASLEAIVDETEADPDIWVVVITGAGGKGLCQSKCT